MYHYALTPFYSQEQKTAQSPDDWVRLISSDGFTYLVRRKVAHCSGMLKNTLDIDGMNAKSPMHLYITTHMFSQAVSLNPRRTLV